MAIERHCVSHGSKVDSGLRTTALDDCLPSPPAAFSVFYYMQSVSLKLYIFPIPIFNKGTHIYPLVKYSCSGEKGQFLIHFVQEREEREHRGGSVRGMSGQLRESPCQPCPCRHEWCPGSGWVPVLLEPCSFFHVLAQISFYIQGQGVFPESSNETTTSSLSICILVVRTWLPCPSERSQA